MRTIAVVAALTLLGVACGSDDDVAGPVTSIPDTSIPGEPDTVPIVEVIEEFAFYGPCGNSSIEIDGTVYYQILVENLEEIDLSRYPTDPGTGTGERGPTGLVRVPPPEPGDDIGTMILYADGIARYESDTGTVEWFTTDEQIYNWEC